MSAGQYLETLLRELDSVANCLEDLDMEDLAVKLDEVGTRLEDFLSGLDEIARLERIYQLNDARNAD